MHSPRLHSSNSAHGSVEPIQARVRSAATPIQLCRGQVPQFSTHSAVSVRHLALEVQERKAQPSPCSPRPCGSPLQGQPRKAVSLPENGEEDWREEGRWERDDRLVPRAFVSPTSRRVVAVPVAPGATAAIARIAQYAKPARSPRRVGPGHCRRAAEEERCREGYHETDPRSPTGHLEWGRGLWFHDPSIGNHRALPQPDGGSRKVPLFCQENRPKAHNLGQLP